jgi:F-type H+-transporting ATPase subunit epsilon
MKLEIYTPDQTVFEGEINSVTVPGTAGAFEVLKDHAPIISTLESGKVIVRTSDNQANTFHIKGGVVEVIQNKVIVLADGLTE